MPFDGFKFTIMNKEVASLLFNQPDLKFFKSLTEKPARTQTDLSAW